LEQQFKGQVMCDQAFEITQGGPRDPKKPDRHQHQYQIENGWAQGRRRDQITRAGHQAHARQNRCRGRRHRSQ
jgi:hypothetical protein